VVLGVEACDVATVQVSVLQVAVRRSLAAYNVAGHVLADRKMSKALALVVNTASAWMALPYCCALADPAENYIARVATPDVHRYR
jgi:hypothetical protein